MASNRLNDQEASVHALHLLLMMMFRYGLRVSEAVSLRLDELDLNCSMLWVHRLEGGLSVRRLEGLWR